MEASREERPLGMQIPAAAHPVRIPPEPPDVGARALYIASRLLAGAATFFFLAFLFAFFYLRSLNQNNMWLPHHIKADQGFGLAIVLCVVLSALLAIFAGRRAKVGADWVAPAIGSILFGLAAVALQCIEYTVQKFGPTNGGYASVFVGWTVFYSIAILCTLYWLETQVATELRARRSPAGQHGDIANPDLLIAPGLDAVVFFWAYLAAIGVVSYVTLYLV
jgi:heme/copper-type cytochrome/quinol oxidase subunit 3